MITRMSYAVKTLPDLLLVSSKGHVAREHGLHTHMRATRYLLRSLVNVQGQLIDEIVASRS
jgi:hypothetical protein